MSKNNNIHELLMVEIMRTSHLLTNPISDIFKKFDLTQSQYNILRILRGGSPDALSAGTIKDRMVNPKSDVTRLMDRLVDKDLISRKLNRDNRRQMDIKITIKGLTLLDKIAPELSDLLHNYQKGLADTVQVQAFIDYLVNVQEQTKRIINK
jgi:DNA-binding MarR family transcriptional regulator